MCGRAKLPDDVSEIKIDLKIDVDIQCSKFPAYSITSSARSLRRSQRVTRFSSPSPRF